MADEWIKVRRNLGNHPKIVRIMSALLADKFRTVGGLHAVWSVFDEFSEDGTLNGYSASIMDAIIGWPGFSDAMIAVGWLIDTGSSLVVPEFDEHNGTSGKRRAMEAKRKRDVRKVSEERPHAMRTKSGLEEEEEEEEFIRAKEPPPSPKATKPKITPVPDGFVQFWETYPRKEGKGAAVNAYAKTTEAERRVIASVLPLFCQSWKWLNEPQYIPHPATWLNQRRWEDDPPSKLPPHPPKMPHSESRQARQLRVLEETANDPRYQNTADRQLAYEHHSSRPATPRDVEPAMDASAGRSSWDDDGLD